MAFVWWPSTDILCLFYFWEKEIFMPKTKFQSIIFTGLMVFVMVYCMTVYTISLKSGALNYYVFYLAVKEMWLEYLVVFCLIFFVITNIANKLTFRIIHAGSLPPIFTILAIQCFTVCQIVPVITLFATLVHNGITQNWFCQWLQLAVICFPMALCTQIFFAGPFVRFIFRKIFKTR